jgi:hypothetical protein
VSGTTKPGGLSLAQVAAEAGKGPIAIPALVGSATNVSAALSQLGLEPQTVSEEALVRKGQVAGTVPAAGSKVAKGAQVDVIVSSGSPHLAYDDGTTVSVLDPSTTKPAAAVAGAAAGPQVEPSWSADGTELIYSQDGQLVLDKPAVKGFTPQALTQPQAGLQDRNPSFAPTTKASVVAFIEQTATGSSLCFASVGPFTLTPSCTTATGWSLGGQVDWAPNGKSVLVLGTQNGGNNFGILEFSSRVPFSAQASSWGQGVLKTNDKTPSQGVFAAAISPNGKKMALVSNLRTGVFSLFVVPAGDFNPSARQGLRMAACQVAWRPDGLSLAVMQPNGLCGPSATGEIIAVDPTDTRTVTRLATVGAHPAWQPVASGS